MEKLIIAMKQEISGLQNDIEESNKQEILEKQQFCQQIKQLTEKLNQLSNQNYNLNETIESQSKQLIEYEKQIEEISDNSHKKDELIQNLENTVK